MQHFHFIVEVVGRRVKTENFQIGQSGADTVVFLVVFDNDRAGNAVHRCGVVQINPSSYQAYHNTGNKPFPVDEVFEEEGFVVYLFFLFGIKFVV